jgi:hypothetical protein
MLIPMGQVVGVVLGDPPAFQSDGKPPPIEGQRVKLASQTFAVLTSPGQPAKFVKRLTSADRWSVALSAYFFWPVAPYIYWKKRKDRVTVQKIAAIPEEREVRELEYFQLWQRDDPIVQLAPGASREVTTTETVGVTQTESSELASSLGLKVGTVAALSSELSAKFGFQTTLIEQRSIQHKSSLVNDTKNSYRRFAIWSVRHEFVVSHIDIAEPDLSDQATIRAARRTLLHALSYKPPQQDWTTSWDVPI